MPTICVARLNGPWSASASRKARSPTRSEISRVAVTISGSMPSDSRIDGPQLVDVLDALQRRTGNPWWRGVAPRSPRRSRRRWPVPPPRSRGRSCRGRSVPTRRYGPPAMARPSVQYSRSVMPAMAAAGMKLRRQTGTRSGTPPSSTVRQRSHRRHPGHGLVTPSSVRVASAHHATPLAAHRGRAPRMLLASGHRLPRRDSAHRQLDGPPPRDTVHGRPPRGSPRGSPCGPGNDPRIAAPAHRWCEMRRTEESRMNRRPASPGRPGHRGPGRRDADGRHCAG